MSDHLTNANHDDARQEIDEGEKRYAADESVDKVRQDEGAEDGHNAQDSDKQGGSVHPQNDDNDQGSN